jgi:SAM-dependent MidA family methyltransferase
LRKLTGNKELVKIIKEKIKKEGAISFRDFMDMALYYPELGYYTSDKSKIGEKGDFFTASELDEAFGALLAKQFAEIFQKLNSENFKIVEIGAGKGYLAYDILNNLRKNYKEIYENIEYVLIEKSQYHIKFQKEILKEFKNVSWKQDIKDFEEESVEGVIFSNELFDAMPVHLIRKKNNQIFEIYLTLDKEENVLEIEKPAEKQILDYLNELNINLLEGMITEVNLDARDYIQKIGKVLKRG